MYGKCECFVIQMLYACVHPVAVLNAAFCMTCSFLMLVEYARGDHMEDYHFVGKPAMRTRWMAGNLHAFLYYIVETVEVVQ